MKDKRQRMALSWPYGIPPDPQLYAYLAAAAASYPYGVPSASALHYPSLGMNPGLAPSGSSAFTPLSMPSPLQPRIDMLSSLHASSPLHRVPGLDSPSVPSPVSSLGLSPRMHFPWMESGLCGVPSGAKPFTCSPPSLGLPTVSSIHNPMSGLFAASHFTSSPIRSSPLTSSPLSSSPLTSSPLSSAQLPLLHKPEVERS